MWFPGQSWASLKQAKQSYGPGLQQFRVLILPLTGRFRSCGEIPYIWTRWVKLYPTRWIQGCNVSFHSVDSSSSVLEAYERLHSSALHRCIKPHLCYVSKAVKTISSGHHQVTIPVLELAFLLMFFENTDLSFSIIIIIVNILMWLEPETA